MALIVAGTAFTQAVIDKLRANVSSLPGIDTTDRIYYGIQGQIPTFPAIECMSGRKNRRDTGVLAGTRKWGIDLSVLISVLYGKVQDATSNQLGDEQLAEAVETVLQIGAPANPLPDQNGDRQVIEGLVTSVDPGVARRPAGVMLRSTLITFEALSQEVF